MPETEPKITLQVIYQLQIHTGIQNAVKSRSRKIVKVGAASKKIIMTKNYFWKILQFV